MVFLLKMKQQEAADGSHEAMKQFHYVFETYVNLLMWKVIGLASGSCTVVQWLLSLASEQGIVSMCKRCQHVSKSFVKAPVRAAHCNVALVG